MVDIHSATAEIRREKKKKIEEETTRQKCNGLPYSIGQPQKPGEQKIHNKTRVREQK